MLGSNRLEPAVAGLVIDNFPVRAVVSVHLQLYR
jgi:hypothetical protein